MKLQQYCQFVFPHVIFHLVLNTCVTKEGINLFYDYATESKWNKSQDGIEIQDPLLIARTLIMPSNSIVEIMIPILSYKGIIPQKESIKSPTKNKYQFFLRYDLLTQMMQVIVKYGLSPRYKHNQNKITSLIQQHKKNFVSSGKNKQFKMSITGPTQAIFYTLPNLFYNAYHKREIIYDKSEFKTFFNPDLLLKKDFHGVNTMGTLKINKKNTRMKTPTLLEHLLIPDNWNIFKTFKSILNGDFKWDPENPCHPWIKTDPSKTKRDLNENKSQSSSRKKPKLNDKQNKNKK